MWSGADGRTSDGSGDDGWLAGLDAGRASGALLSQMRQLATYSRPKGRGRGALKEAWVKSTGGTLGDERGVNRQVAVWRVGEKVNFFQKG